MRWLLLSLLLGASGLGVGYWRFFDATQGVIEQVGDPLVFQSLSDQTDGKPRPKVQVVNGAEFDFGRMQRGTRRKHEFILKNIGDAPLKLTNNGSTCKCTVGTLDNAEVAPNEETKVILEWRGEGHVSVFGQSATIGTNDPSHREVKLVVRGELTNASSFEPPVLSLGDFLAEEPISKEVILFSTFEEPLEIKKLTWSDTGMEDRVKLSHTIEKIDREKFPGRDDANYLARIKIDIPSGIRGGAINTWLHVESNIDQEEPISLNVTGKCVSRIRFLAAPGLDDDNNILSIGKVNSSEGKTINLLVSVSNPEGNAIELTGEVLKLPPGAMNVTIGAAKGNARRLLIPVTLEIPKGAPAVPTMGTNSQNFARVLFRTKSEKPSEQPLNIRMEIEK